MDNATAGLLITTLANVVLTVAGALFTYLKARDSHLATVAGNKEVAEVGKEVVQVHELVNSGRDALVAEITELKRQLAVALTLKGESK